MESFLAFAVTAAVFAAVPWSLAQLAIRWQPKLQHPAHRRNYRRITAAIAILAAAAIPTPVGPVLWALAIVAAVLLDVHWYRFARTPNGQRQLADATQERERSRVAR